MRAVTEVGLCIGFVPILSDWEAVCRIWRLEAVIDGEKQAPVVDMGLKMGTYQLESDRDVQGTQPCRVAIR